ncbi:MAG: D-aminoacyl-tRNA deacylase [Paracoccus sp. (in: a-proteobacteria)]|nr:D-aminoacyl-tRNA deacylase [Paracoccus sp. (in: a-proteobacteria)]
MRALIQRVSAAAVTVDGECVGRTGPGLVILICAMQGDSEASADKMAARIARLRIFHDEAGKMNRSVIDVGGGCLVVSQFTLAADTRSGNRPGFSAAAPPDLAETLYLRLAEALRGFGLHVETGRFRAAMQVSLTNDGPVTIWLDDDTGGRPGHRGIAENGAA